MAQYPLVAVIFFRNFDVRPLDHLACCTAMSDIQDCILRDPPLLDPRFMTREQVQASLKAMQIEKANEAIESMRKSPGDSYFLPDNMGKIRYTTETISKMRQTGRPSTAAATSSWLRRPCGGIGRSAAWCSKAAWRWGTWSEGRRSGAAPPVRLTSSRPCSRRWTERWPVGSRAMSSRLWALSVWQVPQCRRRGRCCRSCGHTGRTATSSGSRTWPFAALRCAAVMPQSCSASKLRGGWSTSKSMPQQRRRRLSSGMKQRRQRSWPSWSSARRGARSGAVINITITIATTNLHHHHQQQHHHHHDHDHESSPTTNLNPVKTYDLDVFEVSWDVLDALFVFPLSFPFSKSLMFKFAKCCNGIRGYKATATLKDSGIQPS